MNVKARGQQGMSLAEVIVAAALALIGFLVALLIYQASRDLFRRGEQAADQQQAVRLGFDQMARDLRLAGYNSNPDGSQIRSDEQIEGAWGGAVFVRGDYDNEDATKSQDPEVYIEGPFNISSTGNDEIIGYILRKPDGTGDSSVQITVDVNSGTTATSPLYGTVAARDNVGEVVTIPNVALSQTSPPYTLYKVSFSNSTTGCCTGNWIQYTPIADNIRSMSFTYYNDRGTQVATPPGGAETASAIQTRKEIRRVLIRLEGMTATADRNWTDSTDTNPATRNFRKFFLQADVSPRNLGMFGVADIDTTAPTTPTGLASCPGHCQGMTLTWNANNPSELVTQYTVRYGTSATVLNQRRSTGTNNIFIPGLTSGSLYYFQLRAEDAANNVSSWTASVSDTVRDTTSPTLTTPSLVTGGKATGGTGGDPGLPGHVDVSWNAVTTNAESLSCEITPQNNCRDLKDYGLWKAEASGSPPYACPGGTPIAVNAPFATDSDVVNCRDYVYCMKGRDNCAHESAAMTAAVVGRGVSTTPPFAPQNVLATRSASIVTVDWDPVTTDTTSASVRIEDYDVYQMIIPDDGSDPNATGLYRLVHSTTDGTTDWVDTTAPPLSSGKGVYYRVKAKDDCPNISAFSNYSQAACQAAGVANLQPEGVTLIGATHTLTVDYSATDAAAARCELVITKTSDGTEDYRQTLTGAGPFYFTWSPGHGNGPYTAVATVTTIANCVATDSETYRIVGIPTCCLQVDTTRTTHPGTGSKSQKVNFFLRNDGTCSQDVVIDSEVVKLMLNQETCNGLPRVQKITNVTTGAVVFCNNGGACTAGRGLPASITNSPTIQINDGQEVRLEILYDIDIQDKCGSPSITRRDKFSSDFNFTTIPTTVSGSCTDVILNSGAPTQ